jgi:GTP-binding protein
VVLNKIDVPDARDMADLVRPDIEARAWPVFAVSAVSHEGLRELTYALADLVTRHRESLPAVEPTRTVLRPRPVDDAGFTVEAQGDGSFVIRGARPERWVQQTNFDNDDWEPSVYAGREYTPGQRGSDHRLESSSTRATAAQRLAARKARRGPTDLTAEDPPVGGS